MNNSVIPPYNDEELANLKDIAAKATQGEWWVDSHGSALTAMASRNTIIRFESDPDKAVRHEDTGNLSCWKNDWDATYIPTASPYNIQRLIARLEVAEQKVAELST